MHAASPPHGAGHDDPALPPLSPAPFLRTRLPPTPSVLMEPLRPFSSGPPDSPPIPIPCSAASVASRSLRPSSAADMVGSPTRSHSTTRPSLPSMKPMKRSELATAAGGATAVARPSSRMSDPCSTAVSPAAPEEVQQHMPQIPSPIPDAPRHSAAEPMQPSHPPLPSPAQSPYASAMAEASSAASSCPGTAVSTPRLTDRSVVSPMSSATRLSPISPALSDAALAGPSLPSFSGSRSRARSLPRGKGSSLAAFTTGAGHQTYPGRAAHSSPTAAASAAAAAAPDAVSLRLHVITFNMGDVTPSRLPPEMFGVHRGDADVYVVCTQESCAVQDLDRLLAEHLPESQYSRVGFRNLMAINLFVFVRKDIEHLAANIAAVTVPTGIGNVLGNKGGVAIGLRLAGAHILLINSHLAAHDAFVERRNADFHRICAGLPLPPQRVLATSAVGPERSAGSGGARGGGSGGRTFLTVVPLPQAALSQPELPSYPPRILIPQPAPQALDDLRPSPLACRPSLDLPVACSPTDPPLLRPGGPLRLTHNYHPLAGPGAAGIEARRRASMSSEPPATRMNRVASSSSIVDGSSAVWNASAVDHYDVVLWAGDLNYRIQGIVPGIKHALEKGMYEVLAANDQLAAEQRAGRAFQGFHEQPLNFLPTFKFINNSDEYNLKRIPSWTDRVMFLCNSPAAYCALRPLYYACIHEMKESDHRPVVGGFEVVLNPTKKHLRHAVEF